MKRRIKQIIAVLACAVLIMGLAQGIRAAEPDELEQRIRSAVDFMQAYTQKEGGLLSDQALLPAGSSLSDWTAIAFERAGIEGDFDSYRKALETYVSDCYRQNGGIDRTEATEYHRVALAAIATGADPTNFGTDADGNPVNLIADGTYDFLGNSPGRQGLNGWIFALITLDAKGFEVPEGAKYTREDMLSAILSAQEEDGGFGLTKGTADVDITAMALQALSPYMDRKDVAESAEKALDWLGGLLSESGSYSYLGEEASESSSQVIIALCSLGIDPESDARFSRGGRNVLETLEDYRRADGGYAHTKDEDSGDFMASQQAILALTAVNRLRMGQTRLYDFTNGSETERPTEKEPETTTEAVPETETNTETTTSINALYIIIPAAVIILAVVIVLVIRRRKKDA